jgi:beta-lactam-binding protein with PASTA domain
MPTINVTSLVDWNKIGVDALWPLSGTYLQTAPIDAMAGINAIGTGTTGAFAFSGTYDGGGNAITNITINNAATDYQAPFGSIIGGTVTRLSTSGTVSGKSYVGGIAGRNAGIIDKCNSSCAITAATGYVGCVVGGNVSGTVQNCFASGAVTGGSGSYTGGAVGYSNWTVTNVIALGNVTGASQYVGGCVGSNAGGTVTGSFSTGMVPDGTNHGLFIGRDSAMTGKVGVLTVPQAKDPLWYIAAGWDFTSTWVMTRVQADITGMTVPTATALLAAQGCTLSITSSVYHATVPSGQILTQSIAAGGTAGFPQLQAHGMPASPKTGDVVAVTVSLGNQVPVPGVIGIAQATAESRLAASYFTATVVEATDENVQVGLVISQNPTGGTNATYQSAVTITVSTGHANVTVPDVVGDGIGTAIDEIEAANLTATITGAFSGDVDLGYVISQNPAASASVSYGSNVDVEISLGVQTPIVPDVVGEIEIDAIAAIEAVDLVAAITEAYDAIVADGVVISQDVAPDTTIEAGSEIGITVSKGVEPATVPDVVGEHFVAATALIENAGLTVTKTDVYSTTVAVNFVVDQDPAADTLVAVGSAVEIDVSQGAETVPVSSGIYSRMRKQNAIYWPPATMNDFGEPVYGDLVELVLTEGGVNYRVRWEDVIENYIDAQGTVQQSTTTVYVPPLPTGDEVELNGYLWKGDLAGLTSTTDPTLNPGAEKIKQFKQIPNMKATQILRAVYL